MEVNDESVASTSQCTSACRQSDDTGLYWAQNKLSSFEKKILERSQKLGLLAYDTPDRIAEGWDTEVVESSDTLQAVDACRLKNTNWWVYQVQVNVEHKVRILSRAWVELVYWVLMRPMYVSQKCMQCDLFFSCWNTGTVPHTAPSRHCSWSRQFTDSASSTFTATLSDEKQIKETLSAWIARGGAENNKNIKKKILHALAVSTRRDTTHVTSGDASLLTAPTPCGTLLRHSARRELWIGPRISIFYKKNYATL